MTVDILTVKSRWIANVISKLFNHKTNGIWKRVIHDGYRIGVIIDGSFGYSVECIPFFRGEYTKRMHSLIDPVFDNLGRSFNVHGGIRIEETPFWVPIYKDSRKHRILQHLYTYQKKYGVNLYDTYKELLHIQKKIIEINPKLEPLQGSRLEEYTAIRAKENKLLVQFATPFSEIYEKIARDSYPDCGACEDCLWYTRHNIFRYAYDLWKKKKSDPNAWKDPSPTDLGLHFY